MPKHITLRIAAAEYENHDDVLAAVAAEVGRDTGRRDYDYSPRWEDNQRDHVLIDLPIAAPADEYTVIDDGAFVYPIHDTAGETAESLRVMGGDEYSLWCADYSHDSPAEVGTTTTIALCAALVDAGANLWRIA